MTIETLLFSATAQILASAALGPLPQGASLYLSLTRARKFVFQMASFAIPVSLKDFFTLNYRILNYYTETEYDQIIQVFITPRPRSDGENRRGILGPNRVRKI